MCVCVYIYIYIYIDIYTFLIQARLHFEKAILWIEEEKNLMALFITNIFSLHKMSIDGLDLFRLLLDDFYRV